MKLRATNRCADSCKANVQLNFGYSLLLFSPSDPISVARESGGWYKLTGLDLERDVLISPLSGHA